MSEGSTIQWCDATWQPVVGCSRVSAGCDNCYAIGTVNRFRKRDGLTKLRPKDASRPGLDWSGKVLLQAERLGDPLKWRKARRVFVCSQADLFHDAVPLEYIAAVFGVMAACPQHTFLVLTKRASRAHEFFTRFATDPQRVCWAAWANATNINNVRARPEENAVWPLPNVHLGVSVEDQATADERIPVLLDLPAELHWISAEPLLGEVRIDWALWREHLQGKPGLRWVVVGGESGPRARPFNVAWARDLLGYAAGSGCPVFVKQLGSRPFYDEQVGPDHNCVARAAALRLADYSGGDMAEWPADLRVREVPT